jgi:cyanophycinase-like exopeptidase
MVGTLTLIGSGEFSTRFISLYRQLLARVGSQSAVFVETPAGFQANADELTQAAQAFFQRELNAPLEAAPLRHSRGPAEQIQLAKERLTAANFIVAGPGSPTYAIRHWRATEVNTLLARRLAGGAQLVFASSAAIAISRRALPVYEIYKVGDDPYWADGLDLLGDYGFDLAIVTHWNNREPRCFMGLARFEALAAQLPPTTVLLGVDENTSVTLDLAARTATVAGQGGVTIQHGRVVHVISTATTFELDLLTPAGASTSVIKTTPVAPAPHPTSPISDLPKKASSNSLEVRVLADALRGNREDAVEERLRTLPKPLHIPAPLYQWAAQRDALRAEKKFAEADQVRERIAALGYALKDSPSGPVFSLTQYPNSNAVPSQLDQPDTVQWSVVLLAQNNADEIVRAVRSVLEWGADHPLEVVIVDDASSADTRAALADFACDAPRERVRLVYLSGPLGEGAGRNAGLRTARGTFVMILGGHVEIAGDVFTPLTTALADETIGAAGSNALVTEDLFTFHPAPTPEADAIEFYLFAFRRDRLKRVGGPDEKFVFYRNLDLDWSFAFKDQGLRLVGVPGLPLVVHEHPYLRMEPTERDKLSKKNYRRFLDKWRERTDLLVSRRP